MGTELLKKIAVKIEKKQNTLFTYPVEKQKKYLQSFAEPKNGFERGYFQYCCQMKLYGKFYHSILNVLAYPLSLYYRLKLKKSVATPEKKVDAVFFNDGKPFNIIPNSVIDAYEQIENISDVERCLSKQDRIFLKKIYRKHPFSWMLWLKLILKISQYSWAITKYSPTAVISCSEYSFTAPILTEYCHSRGVKLINVMHGEKLFDMRDSFSGFDEFYVWGEEYVNLLCSLRADREQFRIEVPKSLKIEQKEGVEIKFDYTYYLGAETETELKKIGENLKLLQDNGCKVCVRPHPRYSNMDLVNKIFCFANVEKVAETTIEESLLQTRNAISLFSTVLTQAYHSGLSIVIDDICATEKYEKLNELQYVMLSVEHKKLSKIVGEKK